MENQNYKNHVRFYPPHHFVFYPLSLAMLAFCIYSASQIPEQKVIWYFLASLVVLIIFLSFMLRQHYALLLQNRLIKTEMRLRYYVLTNQRFELIENKLTDSQIFALRFASDAELPTLADRAIKENLSGDAIKKSIVNWYADTMRA